MRVNPHDNSTALRKGGADTQHSSAPRPAQREGAQAAWKALVSVLGGPNGHLRDTPASKRPANVWTQAQGAIAALDVAKLTGNYTDARKTLDALHTYKLPDGGYAAWLPKGAKSKQYMDDNTHVALAFIQAYKQTDDHKYLKWAQGICDFVGRQQLSNGAIPWFKGQKPQTYPTTVASRTAQVGAELYQLTKNPHDLAVAKSACHFMNKHLLRKSGLYAHRLEQDGTLRPGNTSVEQGSAIGALVSMYEATHDRDYLNQAKTTAQAAMKSFTLDKLKTQPESFNAIYFRGLEKLRQYDPHNPEYKKSLDQYLRYAQNHGRVTAGPDRDFFDRGGLEHYGDSKGPELVDQAGMVQLLALEKLTPRGAGRVS